jgi:protein disulfide-isomerase A1
MMASKVSLWSCIFVFSLVVALSTGEDESKEYVLEDESSPPHVTKEKDGMVT